MWQPRAPSRDFKSWGFASNEGLTTLDKTLTIAMRPRASPNHAARTAVSLLMNAARCLLISGTSGYRDQSSGQSK